MLRLMLALTLTISLVQVAQATDSKPNIVLIIADDMNWNDCGVYGHPHIRTPHIDQLSNDGIRFEHAYLTVSSCSPSRSSIITGKYPHNTGAEQLHWPLPPDAETFVANLTASGYYTAAAGKWHLGESAKSHFSDVYEASTAGFQLLSGAVANASPQSKRMVAKAVRLRKLGSGDPGSTERQTILHVAGSARSSSRVRHRST